MNRLNLLGLLLALLALVLAACSTRGADLPAPAGASRGLNTFIFFYTDP
jgi:hypothetical protein